jgi:predicted nuclease of predicted toxin-antitoxin system
VLARAAREERVLLTFDKDFGELAKSIAVTGKMWSDSAAHSYAAT